MKFLRKLKLRYFSIPLFIYGKKIYTDNNFLSLEESFEKIDDIYFTKNFTKFENDKIILVPKNLDKDKRKIINLISENYGYKIITFESEKSKEDITFLKNGKFKYFQLKSKLDYLEMISFSKNIQTIQIQKEIQNFKETLKSGKPIFLTIIPKKEKYEESFKKYKSYEKFNLSYKYNLSEIENNFENLKNKYIINDAQFFIIENNDLIKELNLSNHNIGDFYIMEPPTIKNDFDKNIRIDEKCYNLKQIGKKFLLNDFEFSKKSLKKKFLEDLNEIKNLNDLEILYRTLHMFDIKKIMVFFLDDFYNKNKFFKKINDSKDFLLENNVFKIFTQEENFFEDSGNLVFNKKDNFNIRLIDFSKKVNDYNKNKIYQKNIFQELSKTSKMFFLENLKKKGFGRFHYNYNEEKLKSKFIKNLLNSEKIYYESNKNISSISKQINSEIFEKLNFFENHNQKIKNLLFVYKENCPDCELMEIAFEEFCLDEKKKIILKNEKKKKKKIKF